MVYPTCLQSEKGNKLEKFVINNIITIKDIETIGNKIQIQGLVT